MRRWILFLLACQPVAFCQTNLLAFAKVRCSSPTEEVNLHASAETNSPVLEVLQCDEKVSVAEKQGDWYAIAAASGKPGYVRSSFLTFSKLSNEAEHPIAYVDCLPPHASVSLSDAPDSSKTAAEEPCDDKVSVLEQGVKWEKVQDKNGNVGYVRAIFLSQNPKPKSIQQEPAPQKQNLSQIPNTSVSESGAYPLSVRVLQAEQVPYVVQYSSGQVSTSCAINGSTNTHGTAMASGNVAFGNSTSYSNLTMNCNTYETPPVGWRHVLNAMLVVASNGNAYIIACDAAWRWSKCRGLLVGDVFQARVGGKGLVVQYLANGKIKEGTYSILQAKVMGR